MSTSAQITANQANAQRSSGPKSDQGKAISALNHFRHGLSGSFTVLSWEDQDEFNLLEGKLLAEHQPATPTEDLLIEKMSQSFWLRRRALTLQQMCFSSELPLCDREKDLALYMRYQTTHDRAFSKALDDLQKLRATTRKQEKEQAALAQRAEKSKFGFESQQRKQAEAQAAAQRREAQERRREAAENRAQEIHQARVWLTETQAHRHALEITIAKTFRMPNSINDAGETMAKKAA